MIQKLFWCIQKIYINMIVFYGDIDLIFVQKLFHNHHTESCMEITWDCNYIERLVGGGVLVVGKMIVVRRVGNVGGGNDSVGGEW